jgi:hypothetical protein
MVKKRITLKDFRVYWDSESLKRENIESEMNNKVEDLKSDSISSDNKIKFIVPPITLSVTLKINTDFRKTLFGKFIDASVNIGLE